MISISFLLRKHSKCKNFGSLLRYFSNKTWHMKGWFSRSLAFEHAASHSALKFAVWVVCSASLQKTKLFSVSVFWIPTGTWKSFKSKSCSSPSFSQFISILRSLFTANINSLQSKVGYESVISYSFARTKFFKAEPYIGPKIKACSGCLNTSILIRAVSKLILSWLPYYKDVQGRSYSSFGF